MEPMRYRPSKTAIDHLLIISGYLRDLGKDNTDALLQPNIENVTVPKTVDLLVRNERKNIAAEAKDDDYLRITTHLWKAYDALELLIEAAKVDPSCAEILKEKRTYEFREIPGIGATWDKTVTLSEMLDEAGMPHVLGNAPCMNVLGGQLQEYIAELCKLPERPAQEQGTVRPARRCQGRLPDARTLSSFQHDERHEVPSAASDD